MLPVGREFSWEEYTFRLEPMSGHTRFSVAILFEADGKRFAHTGDQYFFQDRKAPGKDDWSTSEVAQNHVYQNGAFLESYRESAQMLSAWHPDIIISGHQLPMFTDAAFFERIKAWGEEFAELHQTVSAVGTDEAHFGIDGWGGWIWPYRSHVGEGEAVKVTVTVRNPFNSTETAAGAAVWSRGMDWQRGDRRCRPASGSFMRPLDPPCWALPPPAHRRGTLGRARGASDR